MGFIWNNYSAENNFRLSTGQTSPYMELWESFDKEKFVNIFIRLRSNLIPGYILQNPDKEKELLKKYSGIENSDLNYVDFANIFIHFLAQLDRCHGINLEFVVSQIEKEIIISEKYGKEVRDLFLLLKEEHQKIVLRYLAKYDMKNQIETVFDAVLYALFKDIRLYHEKTPDCIHIVINAEETDYNISLFKLCSLLFKDINIEIKEVLWEKHFGIIGIDESMKIDQLAII